MEGQNAILDAITPTDEDASSGAQEQGEQQVQEQQQAEPAQNQNQQDEFEADLKKHQGQKFVPYDRFQKLAAERRQMKERLGKLPADFDPEKYQKDREALEGLTQREALLNRVAETIQKFPWLDETLTDLLNGKDLPREKVLQALNAMQATEQQKVQAPVLPPEVDGRLKTIEQQLNERRQQEEHQKVVSTFQAQTTGLMSNPKFKDALQDKSFLEEVFDRAEVVQIRLGDKELVNLEKVAAGVLERRMKFRENLLEEQRKLGQAKPGAGVPRASGPSGSSKGKPKPLNPANYNQLIDALVEDDDA